MRATKGLWAAVGAGTSLAAAGILALLCVSFVLAVHGWPQVAGETVKSVTGAAGDAIRPASPTIADTVTKTGDQAGNVIEQVGSQVGGLVGGLTAGDTS